MFTIANKLSKDYDLIAIGDYAPHGNGISTKMRRAMNNRSVIGRFKDILSWTALKSGKYYDVYNEKRTTKTCYDCGHIVKDGLAPKQKSWTCSKCESTHIRDENAAKNGMTIILQEWIKKEEVSLSVPCSGRVSVLKRWTWRVRPSGIISIPRGENCGSTTSNKKLKQRMISSNPFV